MRSFLLLVPFLGSCSALVQEVGNNPRSLIGKPRAEVLREFGTPVASRKGPHSVASDVFHVSGAWRESDAAPDAYFRVGVSSLGLLEPVALPISLTHKAVDSTFQRALFVDYNEREIVRTARVAKRKTKE